MIERLKDWLWINKYSVSWSVEHNGIKQQGNSFRDYGIPPRSRSIANACAKHMNKHWGSNSHWVVREN